MRGKTLKGLFTPNNPTKYKGNAAHIVYRSSWELDFMRKLDDGANVVSWASEEIAIKYQNPIKQHVCRYYPDFLYEQKNNDGTTSRILIEIKPLNQVVQPKKTKGKAMKTYMNEMMTWSVNQAKWKAAKLWCERYGIKFMIVTKTDTNQFLTLTEKELGI